MNIIQEIISRLPQKRHQTPAGWTSFNCVMCTKMGESADKRSRAGVITDGSSLTYSCFNCGFKAKVTLGQTLSNRATMLMQTLGFSASDIRHLTFKSLQLKDFAKKPVEPEASFERWDFKEQTLPSDLVPASDCPRATKYLSDRGITDLSDFYASPSAKGRYKNRVVIPYRHKGKIIAWTSRFFDNHRPKYKNEHKPAGYLYGLENQKADQSVIVVVEGLFDAISINGVALEKNTISKTHEALLRNTGKRIIMVPDQDKDGLQIVEEALSAGFDVSIPDWPDDVKDVNDSVQRYGKIGTMVQILNSIADGRTTARLQVRELMKRKNIK